MQSRRITFTLTTAIIVKSYQIIVCTEADVPHRQYIRIEDTRYWFKLVGLNIDPNKSTLNMMKIERKTEHARIRIHWMEIAIDVILTVGYIDNEFGWNLR